MKTLHNTNVWKIEKDGSLSLSNRFGHSGRLAYQQLSIANIMEFDFITLCSLSYEEAEFLADLLCKFEHWNEKQIPIEKQQAIMS